MDSKYASQYRSMNVNHLLDDELEYELVLRKVEYSSGESRDIKRRKLRGAMKEEKDSNRFVSRSVIVEARESESRQVEEKIAMIRDSLENRKAKKAEFPQFETRLVHLYFRLQRLRKVFNTAGLEQIVLGLLNEYFPRNSSSKDPEVVGEPSARNLPKQSSQEPYRDESEEEEDSNPRTEEEREVSDDEVFSEDLEFTMRNVRSRRSSTPKSRENQVVNADELVERIMQRVDQLITTKLRALNLGARTEPSRAHDNEKKRSSRQLGKKDMSLPLKAEKKRQLNMTGEQRGAKIVVKKSNEEANSDSSDVLSEKEAGTDQYSEIVDTDTDREEVERNQRLKRRPRPVCDWKLKYDGRDDGRGLNKFISEVEFMAEAENISKRTLFSEAIHLFSGDARSWYIEGRRNREFRNWTELVAELKLEYQPPDMDYHYEQQAAARRQKRGEKFQDYYNAIKEIFEQMAVPPTEHRKFDIIFRNLRSDYKNSLLVKGVRTLRMLKVWGRKLDSANWFLYHKSEGDQGTRSSQIHEISRSPVQRRQQPPRNDWKDTGFKGRSEWRNQTAGAYQGPRNDNRGPRKPMPEQRKTDQQKSNKKPADVDPGEGCSKELLQKRVEAYRIPERTVCFNCRGNYHHSSACLKPKEIFCSTCGFQGFRKPDCPFCAKNEKQSM
ncbi:uncharacterized protein LOC115256812 [Aedes albopictus]|uniref:Retrotransposon gag domain-containing protein n=1 Tax=Aedes albopictus TaxID=7160 RepID=A0ABM2A7I6_AEDAL